MTDWSVIIKGKKGGPFHVPVIRNDQIPTFANVLAAMDANVGIGH